jgi:hypothetical protein
MCFDEADGLWMPALVAPLEFADYPGRGDVVIDWLVSDSISLVSFCRPDGESNFRHMADFWWKEWERALQEVRRVLPGMACRWEQVVDENRPICSCALLWSGELVRQCHLCRGWFHPACDALLESTDVCGSCRETQSVTFEQLLLPHVHLANRIDYCTFRPSFRTTSRALPSLASGLELFRLPSSHPAYRHERSAGLRVACRHPEPLPAASTVGYYAGVIVPGQASRRSEYSFRLTHSGADDNAPVVDAEYLGNLTRFINHSASPSCEAEITKLRGGVPCIRIFVGPHDLLPGTEITIDYGSDFWV